MPRNTGDRPGFPARLDTRPTAPLSRGGPLLRPQAPVRQAHADAVSDRPRAGLGLVSADVRARMVERLRDVGGIRDERVLEALRAVERHRFVDAALAVQAYEDTSLPIGHGQTISKPSIVARMIELLLAGPVAREEGSLGRTLEIGTGCGYQAAVLCRLASDVYSIERIRALHDVARLNLDGQRPRNLRLVHGDGMLGHPPNAPYRSIIAAAGGGYVPPAWLEQLTVGGRLVAPVAEQGTSGQALVVIDRTESGFVRSRQEAVLFVPLKSGSV